MKTLEIARDFEAVFFITEETRIGDIHHVERHSSGGSLNTPIARFFVHRPGYIEGVNPHWRIDCFVKNHSFSATPEMLGRSLASALIKADYCPPPVWVSWHESAELAGEAIGDLFEVDQ